MRPFVRHYDRLYADKDYDKDVRDFFSLIDVAEPKRLRVLEIGCGTGNQSFRLAPRVHTLMGVEIDPDFAELFEEKLGRSEAGNICLARCTLDLLQDGVFDASAAFFHVLNYIDRDNLAGFCESLANRMRPGGRFVADLWHAEAALADPPRVRQQEKRAGADVFQVRIVPEMDPENLTVTLAYHIEYGSNGHEGAYLERMKLFLWTRRQLSEHFAKAGFEDIQFWDYRRFPERATEESWRLWFRATRASN